ncbi:MAG: hypothetical protein IT454_15415 [Planctomycetes bacterium]|nr:hypothetical protein [Planctomycetota bacterium]
MVTPALEAWRAEHGANWHVDVDNGTGYAEFLFGGALAPDFQPHSDADWFTLARGVLGLAQDVHGIEQLSLVEESTQFLPLGLIGSNDKLTVRFRQMISGVPVEAGNVNVLFDMQGRMLSIQTRALPHVAEFDVRPTLNADQAQGVASATFLEQVGRTGSVQGQPELVVRQLEVADAEQRTPLLAYKVALLWEDGEGHAAGYTYFVDARTGAVADRENLVHHFDVGGTLYTKATPGNYPDTATNPATQQPMKYARLTSSAGTVTTDANGNFNFVGASGPLNITCTYTGTFNTVNNSPSAAYSLAFSAATGTANSIVLNNTPAALVTAQANCFQASNTLRDWIRSVNPTDATADIVYVSNANIASSCNAYFNGSSVNFYQAGGGCVNTAFANVILHEEGHWLNVRYGTGNGSDGMGEGNADIYAMYVQDDPIVGHNFCGTNCNVRDGNNNTTFCGDSNPACYGEVHTDGEPWMGAAWKIRTRLKTSLGTAAGGAVADNLFLDWMLAYNQTQIRTVIETQWLTLDDNDGNINNGTPHFADIDGGFRAQGFPGFTLIPISITNVTQLADTTNQAGPYGVSATMSSNFGSSVTAASLFYRAGSSGAFTSVPMINTSGNTWSASIPGQIAPKRVYYYVRGNDGLGNTMNFPLTAPTSTLSFAVGAFNVVFCDNFDADNGWTVTNTSVTSGAWERGDPIGTTQNAVQAQPEVDNPAGTGVNCYFTDQGTAGSTNVGEADLDGGPTVLTSPAIDLSSGIGEISYAYWLYNDDGDDSLTVQVATNAAGTNWVTARTYTGLAGGWATDTVDVSAFLTPTATTRIRFSVSDNPNNSVTEAAIDDVCATTLGPVGCQGNVATFCVAKLTSNFCVPSINFNGIPSASAALPFDIVATSVMPQKNGLLFYGYGTKNAPFQGGTMCVQSPLRRTPLQNTGGSTTVNDCSGTLTYDFNARIQSGDDTLLVAGQACAAQYYFRDPGDVFNTGLTNAVSFTICP